MILAILIFKINSGIRSRFFRLLLAIKRSCKEEIYISEMLVKAVISIEDRRYFKHLGVDFYSILRAAYNTINTSRIEGASTITQQLVRNVTNMRKVSLYRKVKEMLLSILLERVFSKKEILYAYLATYRIGDCDNIISFCISKSLDIQDLTNNDSAIIAARLKYPNISTSNYIRYLKRVRIIEKKLDGQ